ncbi:MAG: hypothetical protein LEGION0398_MBIBDBAK_00269 [Legionellaceae bacterium]
MKYNQYNKNLNSIESNHGWQIRISIDPSILIGNEENNNNIKVIKKNFK